MKKEVDMERFWAEAELRQAKFKEILEQIALKTGVQIPVRELDRKKIEENVEYTKAKTKEIKERIIAASGDLFESEKEQEFLHISIRVSCDFHKFLLDFGDTPPRHEAEYVAETIRSGLDWFFPLAITCHYLDDDLAVWSFDRQAVSNFRDLRSACLKRFESLCDPSAPIGVTLAALLAFIHLELIFMAQTYPFFVHSYVKEDQWLINRT